MVKIMMLSSKYPVFTLHQGNHCSSSKPTQKTSLATTNTVLAHNGVPRSTCLPQEHSHGPPVLGNVGPMAQLHPAEQLAPQSNSVAQEHWHNVPPVPREHWSHGPPVSPGNIGPMVNQSPLGTFAPWSNSLPGTTILWPAHTLRNDPPVSSG